ncbi:MAG: hypothetical protein A4E27_01140 [Methanobacterium sp. PtaU1.Bin242]|nr:MAG: hypothetical protein A4E27_01140 [Methanobacterium sp. PtaU1.Bin242]
MGEPPMADSSGPVASSNGLPLAPSLIESKVDFCAANGTVKTKTSASDAASGFSAALRLPTSSKRSLTLSTAA